LLSTHFEIVLLLTHFKIVISTEAAHSSIVSCAVEKPAFQPPTYPSRSSIFAVIPSAEKKGFTAKNLRCFFPHFDPKIKLKNVACFSTPHNRPFTHHEKPQIRHKQTTKTPQQKSTFPKTPLKNSSKITNDHPKN
jgi:hypothetical protein